MYEFLNIAIWIFAFVVIPIATGFLLYFLPKKFGYPKLGKYLVFGFILIFTGYILSGIFEDQLFTQKEAKAFVEREKISLNDKFKIEHNTTVWEPSDYYHTFTLIISENDKKNAINEIKHSVGFNEAIDDFSGINRDEKSIHIQNYETKEYFIRERFQTYGKGGAPGYVQIFIHKNENKLVYKDKDTSPSIDMITKQLELRSDTINQ